MSHNRTISKKYEDHLRKSAELLASSVFAVNDRLRDRQGLLVALVEKREQKGGEKNEAEELTERAAESLGRQVPDITLKLETAMRMTVDDQAELVNSKAAAAAMIQQVNQAHNLRRQQSQPRRRHQAVEDDEDEAEAPMEDAPVEVPVVGAVELLEIARKDMIKEYNALSAHQRYALQNDYIHFKGLWHEGAHRDDETPLPDASTWFDNDGNPVIRWGGEGAGAGDDDDADLVVEREVRSYTCPLSLRPLRDPYSSHKCKHTFDKEAIFEYLANGARQCPVAGCSQVRRQPLPPAYCVGPKRLTGSAEHRHERYLSGRCDTPEDQESGATGGQKGAGLYI